jgi:ABC-2 type transporter
LQAGLKPDAETFFQFLLTIMAVALTFNALGHFFAALFPNAQVAGIFAGMMITLFNLFRCVRVLRLSCTVPLLIECHGFCVQWFLHRKFLSIHAPWLRFDAELHVFRVCFVWMHWFCAYVSPAIKFRMGGFGTCVTVLVLMCSHSCYEYCATLFGRFYWMNPISHASSGPLSIVMALTYVAL